MPSQWKLYIGKDKCTEPRALGHANGDGSAYDRGAGEEGGFLASPDVAELCLLVASIELGTAGCEIKSRCSVRLAARGLHQAQAAPINRRGHFSGELWGD